VAALVQRHALEQLAGLEVAHLMGGQLGGSRSAQ
jgi:hypothetical protein